ncbi:hypothetical protein RY831_20015 [Noviherbaspirillum sp. CPCC 100848]|uniref:Uncharacterized protein n=1 Tax=Noviherbaspirillum album TaxID=3080276 RepID=A0ABU6JD34_9BURK|nr:hypothetical protein [Noviherbaspirillum sp. CPCC 100848]MEC4721455.1 hypothetical protein [Noviherbaspirillum sp. CPCC 100848]
MFFSLEASTSRATVHGSFQSGRFISASQEAMNAGHASRNLSLSQPGMAENTVGRNTSCGDASFVAGGATGFCTAGGGEAGCLDAVSEGTVVQAASAVMTAMTDKVKLVRITDIGIRICGY